MKALAAVLGSLVAVGIVLATTPSAARADTLGGDPSAAATTTWFNWVDHASPGMVTDNFHLVNPGASAATVSISVPGTWSTTVTVPATGTTYATVPQGVIGGPAVVHVTSGPGVLASQRIEYYNSFSEIPGAGPAAALQHGWFPWYDRASPGTTNDNIHIVNPGPTESTGVLSLPGANTTFDVPAGGERYYAFPVGTINGPLRFDVTSGSSVIVSQRVEYSASFNEVLALDAAAAQTTLYFNWFDRASTGVVADNIHILNPQPSAVTVTAGGHGLPSQQVTVAAGGEQIVTWAGGIGGPVRLDASAPILATQRIQWPPTFAEWPGRGPADARPDFWFPWYDNASPNMVDDVHVTNPGGSSASVSLSLGSLAPITLNVPAGADTFYSFSPAAMGGPLHVHVNSGPPVLAVQRAFLLPPPPTSRTLNVPYYHQAYALSCEEAALRMALAYEGVNVSEDQIYSVMGIDYRPPVTDSTGFHWGDPYAQFVGDPNGSEVNNTGYGSYNEAIARSAIALGGNVVASGEYVTPDYVYRSVLDGHPVVAWVSFDWRPHSPTFYTAFDGRWIRFGSPYEHAVTIVGVTGDSVLVNNPWQGQQWIAKSTFEGAYGTFNDMAVVIR